MDLQTAQDIGKLDPQAIAQVREDAWPEIRSAEELHDALVVHGFLTAGEAPLPNFIESWSSSAASRRMGLPAAAPLCRGGAPARISGALSRARRCRRPSKLLPGPQPAKPCARSCAGASSCSAR
jgi:hypothetical protein